MPPQRNRILDVFRIVFAVFVLLAHAPELTDGNRNRELFHRITHTPMSFGEVGVDGFFLLSGYLIVQSWVRVPSWKDFFRKRVLRIVPGYAVAFAASVLFAGLFAVPSTAAFFRGLDRHTLNSLLGLSSPATPPVYPGLPNRNANGALWSIAYEFRCYVLVALLGLTGFYRRRWLVACLAALLFVITLVPPLQHLLGWHRFTHLLGMSDVMYRLVSIYFIGICFYLFRDWIVFRPSYAALCVVAATLTAYSSPQHFEPVLALCGTYLLFYTAEALGGRLRDLSFPDISYGIYLYGWPVESFWIWKSRGSPWVAFAGATAICIALGWLSWTFLEEPALRLNKVNQRAVW